MKAEEDANKRQDSLKRLPAITELLKQPEVLVWAKRHPTTLVTDALRRAVDGVRERLLQGATEVGDGAIEEIIVRQAAGFLKTATAPRLHQAINATGIILHTGLGRAVFPAQVVDSIVPELKGCCTLAIDPVTGERVERDELVEPILKELTGAEAATVANNNAAATLLVLAGLAAGKEVVVSRGQLIEIGGSFRLPEVMSQSQARLVEVGATNRTHLKDYERAITSETAAIMRVHPSNYRVVGFTCQPELNDLAALARSRNLILIDDLGAGALVDLRQFGLAHEPTVRESIEAGADIVLCSGDKLIGASQAGIIFGRKPLIAQLRKHPLMRAIRIDKTCAMILERTLHLFGDPERLKVEHPTYRMMSAPLEVLKKRAERLLQLLNARIKNRDNIVPHLEVSILPSQAYLGSGSLPDEAIPSMVVTVCCPELSADEFARRLRLDPASVFGRIEHDRVLLDMRTVTDEQIVEISAAVERVVGKGKG